MLLETLRSLRAYRPGIAYILSNTLYLSPTARSPAGRTMRSLRGPIFEDPADGSFATLDPTRFSSAPLPKSRESQQASTAEHTGFQPLGEGEAEPTASELASLVEEFFSAVGDGATRDVIFQGNGDPLEAADVVVDTVRRVSEKRDKIAFRLNTLGLVDSKTANQLLSSAAVSSSRISTRIAAVSVFLPAATSQQYAELLQPIEGRGFADACVFVSRAAAAGVNVEVTAVDRPDVDVREVEALALRLGAQSFRTRSWVG